MPNLKNNKAQKTTFPKKILHFMVSVILRKYKPRIVMITGSAGKASAKEAIFSVLSSSYRTRKSEKNYNNEIGVPLTILGVESGGSSLFDWLLVFLKWLGIVIFPSAYPEILILEMAADHPGDLACLVEFAHPEISVITEISTSHLEYFKTLIKTLDEKSLAIINVDSPQLAKLKNSLKSNVLTFGFSDEADAKATDVFLNSNEGRDARSCVFKLNYKGTTMPMRLNNALAKEHVYAALAGISVGIGLGMNLVEIGTNLENFSLPPQTLD